MRADQEETASERERRSLPAAPRWTPAESRERIQYREVERGPAVEALRIFIARRDADFPETSR